MIVKEYLDPEIYYIKNILSEEDLKTLQEFVKNDDNWASAAYNRGHDHYERPEVNMKSLESSAQIEAIYLKIFTNFMIPAEPDLKIGLAPIAYRTLSKQTYQLGSSWSMMPHIDENGDLNIKKGLIYYINDDFEGGEIVYTNKKIKHKPIANSMIIHSATPEYEHGVKLVNEGTRYFITNFYKK